MGARRLTPALPHGRSHASHDKRFREVKGTQLVSGAARMTLTATGSVRPSTAPLSKSPRQPGRQQSLAKARPQRPGVLGSSEQPHGPLLPWPPRALCAVVIARETDPEIGKRDATSGYRAGGDRGWPGGEGRGRSKVPADPTLTFRGQCLPRPPPRELLRPRIPPSW